MVSAYTNCFQYNIDVGLVRKLNIEILNHLLIYGNDWWIMFWASEWMYCTQKDAILVIKLVGHEKILSLSPN